MRSVPYVLLLMTLSTVSTTAGIETTMIESIAEVSAGCPKCGVILIPTRLWGIKCYLSNGYPSRSSLIMPGFSFCTIFTISSTVFRHTIDSSKSKISFLVSNLHIIATDIEVQVLSQPISSATSAPVISKSQTHLPTINHIVHTWCTKYLVPGRPGIEYLLPGTGSDFNCRIGRAFSSLIASTRHLCWNSMWLHWE